MHLSIVSSGCQAAWCRWPALSHVCRAGDAGARARFREIARASRRTTHGRGRQECIRRTRRAGSCAGLYCITGPCGRPTCHRHLHEPVGRAQDTGPGASLGHIAGPNRRPAHRAAGLKAIRRTGRAGPAALLGHIAVPSRGPADRGVGKKAIRWAGCAGPAARLGLVATAGRGPAHRAAGLQAVRWTGRAGPAASLGLVATAACGPAYCATRLETVGWASRAGPGAGLGLVATAGGRSPAYRGVGLEAIRRTDQTRPIAGFGLVTPTGRSSPTDRSCRLGHAKASVTGPGQPVDSDLVRFEGGAAVATHADCARRVGCIGRLNDPGAIQVARQQASVENELQCVPCVDRDGRADGLAAPASGIGGVDASACRAGGLLAKADFPVAAQSKEVSGIGRGTIARIQPNPVRSVVVETQDLDLGLDHHLGPTGTSGGNASRVRCAGVALPVHIVPILDDGEIAGHRLVTHGPCWRGGVAVLEIIAEIGRQAGAIRARHRLPGDLEPARRRFGPVPLTAACNENRNNQPLRRDLFCHLNPLTISVEHSRKPWVRVVLRVTRHSRGVAAALEAQRRITRRQPGAEHASSVPGKGGGWRHGFSRPCLP